MLHEIRRLYNKVEPKFPAVRIFKKIYRTIRPLRYKYLFETIKKNKCKRIMEIGTWNGEHALQMIEEAKKNSPAGKVEYYGFDLFEMLDKGTALEEYAKIPPTLEEVREKLAKTDAKISLYEGYTKETLPNVINDLPKMDLVFIDGGHSIETIENDWSYTQQVMDDHTIVIFDDYWNREDAGCKKVVDAIDKTKYEVTILPVQDKFKKEWGTLTINFVQVRLITKKGRTK